MVNFWASKLGVGGESLPVISKSNKMSTIQKTAYVREHRQEIARVTSKNKGERLYQ